MKVGMIVASALLGLLVLVLGGSYITAFNYGNSSEKSLIAQYKDYKNVRSSYQLKVLESSQIPKMYKNDMVELVTAAIEGRYGPDGSQASMQWLREQNPGLDATVYKELQRLISDGRDENKNKQTILIDQYRAYDTALGSFWQGTFLALAGYPKIDMEKYNTVISDSATDEVFESGQDKAIVF